MENPLYIHADDIFNHENMTAENIKLRKNIFNLHGFAFQTSQSYPGKIEKIYPDGSVEIGIYRDGLFITE